MSDAIHESLVIGVVTALAFVVSAMPQAALAQEATNIGTWKLNVAKSKSSPIPVPKSLTRSSTSSGDSVKTSFDGIAADGSRIAYSFTAKFDGKDYPVVVTAGPWVINGANAISLKRTGANKVVATLMKGGKVVMTTNQVVSENGKMLTNTSKGTDESGKSTTSVQVFDKQ